MGWNANIAGRLIEPVQRQDQAAVIRRPDPSLLVVSPCRERATVSRQGDRGRLPRRETCRMAPFDAQMITPSNVAAAIVVPSRLTAGDTKANWMPGISASCPRDRKD